MSVSNYPIVRVIKVTPSSKASSVFRLSMEKADSVEVRPAISGTLNSRRRGKFPFIAWRFGHIGL